MVRLRDAHFYRRVPADVSEATKTGGIVSLIAILTVCWLVLTQYAEYVSERHTTQLRLDGTGAKSGETMRINFNITLPHLPCQFASVHVADHVGSHKMGSQRNVHKVRLDRNGGSLGIYEPHKYNQGGSDKQADGSMAGHVFPWHKKQHTQGDKDHAAQLGKAHLSTDQRNVVAETESKMAVSGKGAQAGRRLLSIEDPAASPPAASSPPPSPPASPPPEAAPAATVPADTSSSCGSWSNAGECASNSGYMLTACATSCKAKATAETCAAWSAAGRCNDARAFMAASCPTSCGGGSAEAAKPAAEVPKAAAAVAAAAVAAAEAKSADPADIGAAESNDGYMPPTPFDDAPADLSLPEFNELLHQNALVMVNFYAPWCFWSNKLTPAWTAVAKRLHSRAYSHSIKFIRVDCTSKKGGELCKSQAIHAFPSIRTYRGSAHAFEPYEFGREENILWLHLVKTAAEILIARMEETSEAERAAFSVEISHVSTDLKGVMERRKQGLDEDWSEDALSADEEVAEDRDLLEHIQDAVSSITGAKGSHASRIKGLAGLPPDEAEAHAVNEHSSDVVLRLLTPGSNALERERGGGDDDGEEMWVEAETHEGCNLFGYIDVARAPGTLHFSPHSARHSFDFSSVNTTHHIDHLSFGLELLARERAKLPRSVLNQLTTLDGSHFGMATSHETQEHHVNIMPTSYGKPGAPPIHTYQFTATSHGRTKDTLPSLLISYDISPIHSHIMQANEALSDFLVSLCAIVGGAVSVFGILDGVIFSSANAIKKQLGKQS